MICYIQNVTNIQQYTCFAPVIPTSFKEFQFKHKRCLIFVYDIVVNLDSKTINNNPVLQAFADIIVIIMLISNHAKCLFSVSNIAQKREKCPDSFPLTHSCLSDGSIADRSQSAGFTKPT